MVNAFLLKMHEEFPVEDKRHFPFKSLAEVPNELKYNTDEVSNTGKTKQPKALFSKRSHVSLHAT